MDHLSYTALSAMRAAGARQAAVANNLANASTTGFRAEMIAVRPLWVRGPGLESRVVASEEVLAADMNAGPIIQTGRDLDVALSGDGLLSVQAENGDEAYTRRGDLSISQTGILMTGDGHPVIGNSGPISLPPADKISIDHNGSIWIVPAGSDPNAPQEVDRLKLVSPVGSRIAKGLDGLFRVEGDGVLPADPDARVNNGQIEGSNVVTSQALVDMIEVGRSWEMQVKMLTTARELDTSTAELMQMTEN
jgi:flagellar basal-body rod protein FlgF